MGNTHVIIISALNSVFFKARAGEISMEDMAGGTFTISNGIVFPQQYPSYNPANFCVQAVSMDL